MCHAFETFFYILFTYCENVVKNIALGVVLAACMMLSVNSQATAKVYGALDIMNPVMHNICALTFDDGPHPRTHKVLDALQAENVRATFFVLGSQVQYFPQITRRIYEEGHEIANHAFSHTALTSISVQEARQEILHTNALLEKLDIAKPRFIRPPLGAYNRSIMLLVRELEMDLVLWSTDSYDWQGRPDYTNMPNMTREAMTQENQRGIFLFHDTKLVTAQDAQKIVQTLRSMGCKHFVTVSEYFDALHSPQVLAALREETTVHAQTAQDKENLVVSSENAMSPENATLEPMPVTKLITENEEMPHAQDIENGADAGRDINP